jgi:2-polyprenyl-3-methyl-5-hydroxy-6-metoxy-1,4-benzoquinol methylase
MTPIPLTEFLSLARQQNVYGYNLKLVDKVFEGAGNLFTGAVVLDAGAGTRLKHFRRQLHDANCVVGIDMAHADLRLNRDLDASTVGDIEQLPFQPQSFECIVSVDAVEHLEYPDAFFHEAARCLKPGGRLIVCTPNLLGYKNLITYASPRPLLDLAWRILRGRPGQPHRTYYRSNTARRIRQIGATAGLTVEQTHFLNEVSHFFYPHFVLSVLAYLYGRGLELLRFDGLLNYMVCVLRKA